MKNIEKFEEIIKDMDNEQLRKMALGMQIFTKICIDNKFRHQRNAIIDFAIIAKNAYFDRELKNTKELPK